MNDQRAKARRRRQIEAGTLRTTARIEAERATKAKAIARIVAARALAIRKAAKRP